MHAFSAAFRDGRFQPLRFEELPGLELHISVLGPMEPIEIGSEEELLAALRPGVDGLVLADAGRRATFLPSVWAQLPRPEDFVVHLKRKAGLPDAHWSPEMRAWRYPVREIG
jgi:hypothetical protein